MARIVGETGLIICPDVQDKMVRSLVRRSRQAGFDKRIVARLAATDSLNIADYNGKIDFAPAFAVVHEVPNQESLFREIHQSMRPGALLLISEPKGHVSSDAFNKMLTSAKQVGFMEVSSPAIKRNLTALLKKV